MKLEEEWKDIEDYPNYQISNFGRVKSKERYTKAKDNEIIHRKDKMLRSQTDTKGYKYVRLYNSKGFKAKKIYRLVAEHYIPNLDSKPQVNHINGDKADNRVENLEWCTDLENKHHAIENGLVDLELRKSNMSKLGKSKKALMKRWNKQFSDMEYRLGDK